MIQLEHQPLLIAVSAPSGAGKTTLCDRLVAEHPHIRYSVSCTTRPPREGEIDGVSYYFLSPEDFEAKVKADAFLEHATVHGNCYGTLKATVFDAMTAGQDVLMDIDVQGAEQIRSFIESCADDDPVRESYFDIFIAPPSMEDLQLRLWGRGKDDRDVIERRLDRARGELAHWRSYRYMIVNDRLDESYATLCAVVTAEHHRVRHLKAKA